MKLMLTNEQMENISDRTKLLDVNGDMWEFVEQDGETEEDEQGRYRTYIYKRQSDDKYFAVTIFSCRYGYKDYGFESDMQDKEAREVEKKEIVQTIWSYVK